VEGGTFGLGVLVFSLVVEGGSMAVAVKGLLGDARGRALGLMEHLRTTDDPFGVAVLLEDGAAVLGVLIALAAVALTERTHVPTWDAAGSIGVGLLLGVLATFLIAKNRTLLIGRSVQPAEQEIIRETLDADPAIDRVEKQRAVVTGSDEARISVKVVFDGAHLARTWLASQDVAEIVGRTRSADELTAFLEEFGKALTTLLGREIDRIEARLRERVPRAKKIDIEPH
jgi:zinc transporter 9